MSDSAGILIIGGGQAAARAASAIRSSGYSGPVRIVSEEPHLPYERPPLSKKCLMPDSEDNVRIFSSGDYDARQIAIECRIRATSIDRLRKQILMEDGARFSYDKLLLATGSSVRRLSIEGLPQEKVFYLRTLDESRQLRKALASRPDIAIIGGGFIGLEVASTARSLGCRVSVVEAGPRLLPRVQSELASDLVLKHHRAAGTQIFLGTHVERATPDGLLLCDGTEIRAQVILAGIGITPNTQLAEQAGLTVRNGIVTDEFGQTSDPDIYAAGDVTNQFHPSLNRHLRLESWDNANQQAQAAALSMTGQPSAAADLPWVWSDQGILNIQMAGAPAVVEQTIARNVDPAEPSGTLLQITDGRLVGGITINRARDMPLIRRMLQEGADTASPDLLADDSTSLRKYMKVKGSV